MKLRIGHQPALAFALRLAHGLPFDDGLYLAGAGGAIGAVGARLGFARAYYFLVVACPERPRKSIIGDVFDWRMARNSAFSMNLKKRKDANVLCLITAPLPFPFLVFNSENTQMNLKCLLGSHKWDGCKCAVCGETRDKGHDCSEDCEICTRCGKIYPGLPMCHKGCGPLKIWAGKLQCYTCGWKPTEVLILGHDWFHDCQKCSRCGKTREEGHDWLKDCEKCRLCGKMRVNAHTWNGCKCTKCGKTRDEGHDWLKDCEKCSVCGKMRVEGHDWSQDCNKCKCCGVTASHILEPIECSENITITTSCIDIRSPLDEISECRKAALAIFPRLSSFGDKKVIIKVTYWYYYGEHRYYESDPYSDHYGWNVIPGGSIRKTKDFARLETGGLSLLY